MYRLRLAVSALAIALAAAGCGSPEPAPAPPPPPLAAAPAAPAEAAPAAPPAAAAPEAPGAADAPDAPPKAPFVAPKTPEEAAALEAKLLAEWRTLPAAGKDNVDINAAYATAIQLRDYCPNGMMPLLDSLAEDPGDPVGKVLVVMAMTRLVSTKEQARLIELSQPGIETTGRACAATLLCFLDTPEANARTTALIDDPDRRVRVATIIALLPRGIDAVSAKLPALLADPETTGAELQQVLFGMPDTLWGQHLDFFAKAMLDARLSDGARERALQALGQLGTKDHLPALEQLSGSNASGLVIARALEAQDIIRRREGLPNLQPQGAPPAAPEAPAPAAQ